jgi:hypothetical protein
MAETLDDERTQAGDRLDFRLPDFLRMSWVSNAARAQWAPRFRRLASACAEMEQHSVIGGIRSCTLLKIAPNDLSRRIEYLATHNLEVLPLELKIGGRGLPADARTSQPDSGSGRLHFAIAVGAASVLATLKPAWDAQDHAAIGALLGFPPCCVDFFKREYRQNGRLDTVWPMALARTTAAPACTEPTVTECEASGPWQTNIFWRAAGLRAVPHRPCSFVCSATIDLARRLVAAGRDVGLAEEMSWLEEILSWPVVWSALHGIAELKSPVVRMITRTDATARKYTISRRGESVPAEAARGLVAPYRRRPTRFS